LANAESELAEVELLAEAKALRLEETKTAREVAESELAKSVDNHGSFRAAVELASGESVATEVDTDSEDVEGGDEDVAESETVSVDVTVVQAEG
jgi:VIT1/CCC1 family predicted Fe2+/Mn2+ transporter